MGKRKRGKDKLKAKLGHILPNSINTNRRMNRNAINLNTSVEEKTHNVSSSNYEMRSRNINATIQDHRFVSQTELSNSPNFRKRVPEFPEVSYGKGKIVLPVTNVSIFYSYQILNMVLAFKIVDE